MQKLNEEILIKEIKKEEKNWKSMELDFSLEYHLQRLTKDDLVKIGAKYRVRGLTSLKKSDLITKLISGLTDNFNAVLNLLDKDRLDYIQKFNEYSKFEPNEIINLSYFRNRGILFSGRVQDEETVIMPREIKKLINNTINEDVVKRAIQNSNLIKEIAGLTYYYGVVEIDDIITLLGKKANRDEVINLLNSVEELEFDFKVENDIIYNIEVDSIEDILEQQRNCNLPYYKFDTKTLIKAGEASYQDEYKQATNLVRVLGELFVVDKDIIKTEIEDFVIAIKNEIPLEEVMNYFLEPYEIETDEERQIFKNELFKLSKTIRRWSLRGFTENEVEAKNNKENKIIKIGRNEPCACGSGKKYKKCCGK